MPSENAEKGYALAKLLLLALVAIVVLVSFRAFLAKRMDTGSQESMPLEDGAPSETHAHSATTARPPSELALLPSAVERVLVLGIVSFIVGVVVRENEPDSSKFMVGLVAFAFAVFVPFYVGSNTVQALGKLAPRWWATPLVLLISMAVTLVMSVGLTIGVLIVEQRGDLPASPKMVMSVTVLFAVSVPIWSVVTGGRRATKPK